MGWFGHKGHLSKLGHSAKKYIFGDKEHEVTYGVEYKANGDGTGASYEIDAGPIKYNSNSGFKPDEQEIANQVVSPRQTTKPQGYSRTTAATAKDIAQGGMTKDEVIEFNMKHPNETALRSKK